MKSEFDWGYDNSHLAEMHEEIFNLNCYESVYSVKNGDVVLDIGASVGPFTWSVMDKASQVIALEPSKACIPILEKNTKGYNVSIENKALGKWDGEEGIANVGHFDRNENVYAPEKVSTISFGSLIEKHNLSKIDFIKTDCEGGEYNLFTDENMPYLLNNVRNIVGEFHLSSNSPIEKVEFRYFRDKYLTQFKNYKVFSIDGVDITWSLFNDKPFDSSNRSNLPPFIDYYNGVIIHISNE
jgi:FkbM family methyltransferase